MLDVLGRSIAPDSVLIGVWLVGPSVSAELVAVDVDGVLWTVSRGSRRELVRVAVEGYLRVYHSLGELVAAIERGHVVGLVADHARQYCVQWRP